MEALFSFVARDPKTLKAVEVNPLEPATDADRRIFEERQEVAQMRKAARDRERSGAGGRPELQLLSRVAAKQAVQAHAAGKAHTTDNCSSCCASG